jgi:hypothetical protein
VRGMVTSAERRLQCVIINRPGGTFLLHITFSWLLLDTFSCCWIHTAVVGHVQLLLDTFSCCCTHSALVGHIQLLLDTFSCCWTHSAVRGHIQLLLDTYSNSTQHKSWKDTSSLGFYWGLLVLPFSFPEFVCILKLRGQHPIKVIWF